MARAVIAEKISERGTAHRCCHEKAKVLAEPKINENLRIRCRPEHFAHVVFFINLFETFWRGHVRETGDRNDRNNIVFHRHEIEVDAG